MSERESMTGERDCGADVAAYVLGALDVIEAEAFLRHMEKCTICRDEVAAFGEVVDSLPMAAPQQRIPRGLKRRVMRQVRAEARRQDRGAPISGRLAAVGAGALVAIAAVVGVELGARHGAQRRVIQASVIGSPGAAQLQLGGGHAELIVRHLPPPPAGRVYEVWLKRPTRPPTPTSALFSVTAAGSGNVDVPGNLNGVSTVMVTQEPAGGSPAPTHPPLIVAQLT
jgi:anti-sigma-K factor RskA